MRAEQKHFFLKNFSYRKSTSKKWIFFFAKRYEGFVKNGGILLSVHADTSEEVEKAKNCLERTDAHDISSTGETKGEWKSWPYKSKDSMVGRSSINN